jgi:hypothetical protein
MIEKRNHLSTQPSRAMSLSTRQPPEAENNHLSEIQEEVRQFTMEQKWYQPLIPCGSNQSECKFMKE